MRSSSKGSRKWKWAGLLGGILQVACGAPESMSQGAGEPPGSLGVSQAPVHAMLDSTLKTVRCHDLAPECDSGPELWGRGTVAVEHYAPSTLGGTCVDGNQGTYSDGEWVDRVRISSQDQKPLTQGRTANIEVTVSLPRIAQNNFLDLYSTTNVTQPSWTLITSLPVTGTGWEQILTASYTVPTGSGVQAIRAALRRGGVASPCTTGPYDDRDDLVFMAAAPYVSGAKATSVAAGFDYSLALRADGTLWGWGDNYYSQLGDAVGQFGSTLPVQGPLLPGVKSVHAINGTSLALRTDGTVWTWGSSDYGLQGNGGTTPSKTPAQVPGLTGVTALAMGIHHVLALKSDGTVWAWGENGDRQLGDGTGVSRTLPVQVAGLTQVTAVAAGRSHSLALKSDGTVWVWGTNVMGCLGDDSIDSSPVPRKLPGLSGVTSIAAGHAFSLAIRGTRELWGWGVGPLGDTTSYYRTPTRTYQWASGSISLFAGPSHAVALDRTQGKAWTWGDLSSHATCQSAEVNYGRVPAALGLTGVAGVSIGDRYAHAFLTDGTVWGWGGGPRQRGNDQVTSGECAPAKVLLP
ncbi:RCC1 domain-containing protein [Cystobacter fuscus]|uniref:RCC1 domain-containing protein n=1 Tax=Cystobacter fuscus TaxID=43 RepID=UPI00068471AA|nr:hypothetical protein [Cystobacter fuscus]